MGRNALLAILLILAGRNAAGVELLLRSEAAVSGGMVRLSDIVDLGQADPADAEALKRVLLFPAPSAGRERTVRRGEVLELLLLSDIEVKRYTFAGAEQVIIRRGGGHSGALRGSNSPAGPVQQSVEHALVSYLQQHRGDDVAWSVAPAIPSRFLAPLKQADQITVVGGTAPFIGHQRLEILARVQGHERRIPIEADVAALARAVVAVRPVARGDVIGIDDLATNALEQGTIAHERLLSLDEVIGREAVTGLVPGRPITVSQVQQPRLVHRGDKVTVHSLAAGVSIATSGKATQDGAKGDVVAVELEDPKRQILAKVSGPLRVEIGDRGVALGQSSSPQPASSLPSAGNTP